MLFVAAAFWPLFYGTGFLKSNAILATTWAVSCVVMSTFTLLPALKVENSDLVYCIPDPYSHILLLIFLEPLEVF